MSASTPVKVYKNMLEAHTAFVLDRYNFMDNLQSAILQEDCSDAKALLSLFNVGNFGELIVGLMADPDLKNREQAIYTVANLLALEHQPAIVQRVLTAVLNARDTVFENFFRLSTQETSAYLIHNIALACHKADKGTLLDASGTRIGGTEMDNFQLDLLQIFNKGGIALEDMSSGKIRRDLLHAVNYVAGQFPVGLQMGPFMRMASDRTFKELAILLDILNKRLTSHNDERDDTHPTVPTIFMDQVLDFFLQLLDDDAGRKTQNEALWGLSNYVVEEGVANSVAVYDELMSAIIEHSLMSTGAMRANAVWVLSNLISRVSDVEAIKAIRNSCGVWTALNEAAVDGHDIGRWKADVVAAEALARLAAWKTAEQEAEDMEVDEEATDDDEEEESVESDDSDDSDYVPEEEETDTDDDDDSATDEDDEVATPVLQQTRRVPNALDLMMGARVPSETVARLANLARAGEWVEVPADLTLTVDDLTSLQLMGYMICRGYIGINPMLTV